ncbi:hypothetical protein F4X73_12155 [Candidatus Poribacteria bacterium]|nr:hypothetical protein [Candidatus Poribacteria bacterium]MYB65435.1 hypothetical protein [Candidatus Poribacteria bacterium]MYF55025.1 hypothetical protein [Candidatus Poribacteria bacterium]
MNVKEDSRIKLMIIGAQKSGTSSLLRYLAQHPDIYTHPQPEMTYFLQDHEYEKGYGQAYAKYFSKCPPDKTLIAKNVMVMCSEDRMQRIHEHNTEIHLVILLREPVSRAYSAYWWARRRGWENIKTFEAALEAEKQRINEDWFKWRQCAYKLNSTYVRHIETIMSLFDVKQVHCILTDELKVDAETVCQKLFDLIGVSSDFKPLVEEKHNQAAMPRSESFSFLFTQFLASRNPLRRAIRKLVPDSAAYRIRKAVLDINNKPFSPPPINPQTQQTLAAYFAPYNVQLGHLIGQDLSHWELIV